MDSSTIERELINLLKLTSEQFAIIRTKHEACSMNVDKELDELKVLIKTKFDKEEGDKLILEIDKIKKTLKFDNSENIERNFSIMNNVINYIIIIKKNMLQYYHNDANDVKTGGDV